MFELSKQIRSSVPFGDNEEENEKATFSKEGGGKTEDSRTKVEDAGEYPYSAIGVVSGRDGESHYFGTGSLIGARIVLTCAHNCYDKKKGRFYEDIMFSPATSGKEGKTLKTKIVFLPEGYKEEGGREEEEYLSDYALLELEEDLKEQYGYFGIDSR